MLHYDRRADCFLSDQCLVETSLVLSMLHQLLAAGVPRGEAARRVLDDRTWENTVLVAAYRAVTRAAVAEAERIAAMG